jgi:ADP-ribosyl-[dinitrogen reductase] hydrolase
MNTPQWTEPLRDRALGAYLGLAIGDALGATVEFMTATEIASQYGVHRQIRGGGWLKLKAGDVTDDTTLSLALGDAIVDRGGWDLRAAADSFAQWLRAGPVDCGNTCRRGIRRYLTDGSLAGPPSQGDAGNGALMRNLPVVLATLDEEPAFEQWTLAQCHITHHHPLSDAATLAFGRIARALLLGEASARPRALADELVAMHPKFAFDPYPGRASGFVVDTVQTVLHHFFLHQDFEVCLTSVVNLGDDADTNGALAGMLAGARCGADRLPPPWLKRLDPKVRRRITLQTAALLDVAAGSRFLRAFT